MAARAFFPTLIYFEKLRASRLEQLNADLRDEAYKLREFDRAGRRWSEDNYAGGYTSYGSMTNLNTMSSVFAALERDIDKHVKQYVKLLEWDLLGRSVKMSNIWVNIMPSQTVHSLHLHPLSVISGTYYVQSPKSAAAIKFEDPRLDRFMGAPPRKAKCKPEQKPFVSFPPRPGHVVLFESWLRHEVPAGRTTDDRISISFNYDWV